MTRLSYIICATPRSGSTLLCDLLANTNVAGKPASYYRRQSIPRWVERLGVPSPVGSHDVDFERAYLAAVIKAGAAGTDMFGLRLMWESLPELVERLRLLYREEATDRSRLEAAFGHIVYVHLSRKDKIGQAISRLKAEQSGLWHVAADGSERERIGAPQPPEYDAARIDAFIRECRADESAWAKWFADQSIKPVELTYEELSAQPKASLLDVLNALGLDPAKAEVTELKTRKMADEESVDWAARFRVERGGPR
jgi:LPS sulfotransferase NodH